jgi:hypothetical protein
VDREALIQIVEGSSFVFSMAIFDRFLSIYSVQDIVWALTIAFEDCSQFPGKEWQLMADFVLDLVFNGVVYDENRANLEKEIRRLRSMRGQLTHRCRTLRKDHENDLLQYRTLSRQLQSRFADQEQQMLTQSRQMEMIVSSESEIRANLFREIITLAKSHTTPRYSKNLYYAAVVILFRSCSTYEFMRNFLPLPSSRAAYALFWSVLAPSCDRLQSLDAMIACLSVQIAHSSELIEGSSLAIDAISCSNTFLGMKHVDLFEIEYLFVIYLQPINPNIKYCPPFVIESESGIGNERIQTKIDEILARIQSLIPRRFIASDGDSSYCERHRSFMDF